MPHPSDLRGPRVVQTWNNIALLVSDGAQAMKEASRYVGSLPASSQLFLYAPNDAAREVIGLAASRGIGVQRCPQPHDTLRVATIAVVFGDCPFDDSDLYILEEQGIPVEFDMSRRKRGGGPRYGKRRARA